jgi:hypothetical protein
VVYWVTKASATRQYGKNGGGRVRKHLHDDEEAELWNLVASDVGVSQRNWGARAVTGGRYAGSPLPRGGKRAPG